MSEIAAMYVYDNLKKKKQVFISIRCNLHYFDMSVFF